MPAITSYRSLSEDLQPDAHFAGWWDLPIEQPTRFRLDREPAHRQGIGHRHASEFDREVLQIALRRLEHSWRNIATDDQA
jgi:hypothetical protein